MNHTYSQTIIFTFAIVPYLLMSWGYTALTDGDAKTFWIALGVLLGIRLFFSLIETLGSILSWRVYGKKYTVQQMLVFLQTNKFPKRFYSHDDILGYIARIEDNSEISPPVKSAATQLKFVLVTFESLGILVGARMYSAVEDALEAHSPRSAAKELTFP